MIKVLKTRQCVTARVLTILTCLTDEYYYTDHFYSIWISGVFNMTQLSQSHESDMSVCRVWRTHINTFHSNWFDVIVHVVDGVSLQYFFIQCQFTEINIISWLISKISFNVMYTFTDIYDNPPSGCVLSIFADTIITRYWKEGRVVVI